MEITWFWIVSSSKQVSEIPLTTYNNHRKLLAHVTSKILCCKYHVGMAQVTPLWMIMFWLFQLPIGTEALPQPPGMEIISSVSSFWSFLFHFMQFVNSQQLSYLSNVTSLQAKLLNDKAKNTSNYTVMVWCFSVGCYDHISCKHWLISDGWFQMVNQGFRSGMPYCKVQ
jgi:hypothetical protein